MHVCGNKVHKGHAPCDKGPKATPPKQKSRLGPSSPSRKTRHLIPSLLLSKWEAILSLLLPPHVVKLSQVALATSLPKLKSLDPYMAAFSALKANNEIISIYSNSFWLEYEVRRWPTIMSLLHHSYKRTPPSPWSLLMHGEERPNTL